MNTTTRTQISVAAFFGFTAVLLGALGAHALEEILAERGTSGAWETAVLYHVAHALALFTVGVWGTGRAPSRSRTWAGACWIVGVILFSGSLYTLALGGPRFLGPITPLGGLFFLAGWVALLIAAWKEK